MLCIRVLSHDCMGIFIVFGSIKNRRLNLNGEHGIPEDGVDFVVVLDVGPIV